MDYSTFLIRCYYLISKNLNQLQFFAKFCLYFLVFSAIFSFLHKNVEKAYLDQHLECTAAKYWSKYTTFVFTIVQKPS